MPPRIQEIARAPVAAFGAGAAALAAGATLLAIATGQAGFGLFIFAAPLGAIACTRFPAATVTCIFLLTGAIGTLTAYTPLPPAGTGEAALVCLWLGVIWVYVTGKHERRLMLWPALLAPLLYLLLTALQILTSDSTSDAFESFRLSTWYMLAFVLIAISPWPTGVYERMARGIVAAAALVGLYAVFRKITGPSADELYVARASLPLLTANEELRFFGSFLTGHQLSAWGATTIPFVLAVGLAWRGRWRLLAAVAVATLGFAVFASNVRTGLVAAALGIFVVIALFMVSRPFAGRGLGIALVAVLGLGLVGAGAYGITVSGSAETADRFSRIFSPTEDPDYKARLQRWDQAYDLIDDELFGHGLGTSGYIGARRPQGSVGHTNIDSSYLKIAIEQGWLIMGLFVLGLVSLLLGLAGRAMRTTDELAGALAIGACGTLVALAMLFYAGVYIEGVTALSAWILIGLGAALFTKDGARKPADEDQPPPFPRLRAARSASLKTRSVPSA